MTLPGARRVARSSFAYAAVVVAAAAGAWLFVCAQMRSAALDEAVASLERHTVLLDPFARRALAAPAEPGAAEETARLGRAAGLWITVMRPDGTPVADSEVDPATGASYRDRPEVVAALSHAFGAARRPRAPEGEETIFVARALRAGGGWVGIVRVAAPVRAVDERLAPARRTLAAGAGLAAAAALAVGLVVARRVVRPLAEMTRVAEAARAGRHDERVRGVPGGDIGRLADTLNRLNAELTQQVAALSQERARLGAVLAGMADGVVAVDDEDRVLYVNRAASRMLGIDEAGAAGTPLWEAVRIAELTELVARARERRQHVRRELSLFHGGRETVLGAYAASLDEVGARGVVVVFHDLTERRELDRVRRDFVANVSHEFKTPLTSIKGYVETLLGGALRDEENNVRFLRKIEDNVERLNALVGQLLSLARVESEEAAMPLGPVDLRPIVEGALRRHEVALERHGLTCRWEPPSDPVVVHGNAEALTEVVDNLLGNAIRYTPPPGTVTLRVGRTGDRGRVEVEDTGVGIAEADRARIFERFYRADRARSRADGGSGLGLAIVKHLVQAMQGEVDVESAPGRGSRFTVHVPLAP